MFGITRLGSVILIVISLLFLGYYYRNASDMRIAFASFAGWDRSEKGVKRVVASHYGRGDGFQGKSTASGEVFNSGRLTAAHRSLPFGTVVGLRNPQTGKYIEVRINDRGPYVKGRAIDLSTAAASALGFAEDGVQQLEMKIVSAPATSE